MSFDNLSRVSSTLSSSQTRKNFIENIKKFAKSPSGIKRFKDLILSEAVKGRLVEQDLSEGNGEELIGLIAIHKAEYEQNNSIKRKEKKSKETPEYFECLPSNWGQAKLSDLMEVYNGRAYKKNELLDKGTPVLRVGNLFTSNQWYYSDLDLEPNKYCEEGDLLYAWSASFGPFIWDGPKSIFHYHIWKLDLFSDEYLIKKYIYTYLLEKTQEIKASGHGIAMIHMTKEKMENLVIPIPPLEEQKRIVTKVDELMALCDQLEAQQQQQANTLLKANSAAIQALLSSQNSKDDLKNNWQRLADNFHTLYGNTLPMPPGEGRQKKHLVGLENIKRVKQAIIDLAIAGKITKRMEDDDTVGGLIEEINLKLIDLVKRKEIKKAKSAESLAAEEYPFVLPEHWKWMRLGEFMPQFQNGASSRGDKVGKKVTVLRLADIKECKISLSDTRSLVIAEESIERYSLKMNDILIIRVNGSSDIVGKFILCDEETRAIYCDHFIRMRFPVNVLEPRFVELVGSSSLIRGRISDLFITTAGQKTVNQKHISSLPIPFPPPNEQKRIINKVDELMSLCDQLEQQLKTAYDQAEKLITATTNALVA